MQLPIPDNLRPYLSLLAKYHFWILAAIVPVLVLPVLLVAEGDLHTKIKAAQGEIDGKLSSLKTVQGTSPHPNESWSQTIGRDTIRVKRDTLVAWQRFYDGQQELRIWPESLGPDFLDRIGRLQPGGRLARSLLERYQDGVRTIVRTLPKRMGAEELMRESLEEGGPVDPRTGAAGKPQVGKPPLVRWNAEDQRRIYRSFDWQKTPSTTQVLLGQEEIWLYQVLCDTVAAMNAGASGSYDAAVPYVEELAVGFPAAEDKPGGAGENRVFRPVKAAGSADLALELPPEGGMDPMAGGEGAPAGRPPHPRFSATVGPTMSFAPPPGEMGGEGAGAASSPEDALKNWIYVGFDGAPLLAKDLTASLTNRMVHLAPFRLRVVMDQRRLDDLLVRLATSPIPIDVRQVRVNPGAVAAGGGLPGGGMPGGFGGFEGGGPPGSAGDAGARRPYDVTVELRGTMALATPPDRKAIFASDADAVEEPAAQEAPPEQPPAEAEPAKPEGAPDKPEGDLDKPEGAPDQPEGAPAPPADADLQDAAPPGPAAPAAGEPNP